MAPEDRMCRPGALDNPIRRWLAPARRELDMLGIPPASTFVDLGAGVGYFAPEVLRRIGPDGRVVLVDIDAENLDMARRRTGPDPRVRFRVGSAASVGFLPDATVDRALLSLVLCCLVEKEKAVDELWRILRPGGRALLTYPRRRWRPRRGPSLRVDPARWASLFARHPWAALEVPQGWVVARHLLERPGPEERAGRPAEP